ncbi:hypothetical protein [Clostridium baratii]|uniref:hypothetical protein n=1 Tax=Clostridium baratii TaxID=1561 RepID=UPI00097FACB3|nr:hypothetical protein [Clostridium baratii]AQM61002.1 hypothetical protein NPD11_435 [Clostridium baratii]
MNLLNFFIPYRCDYKELKKYKKQFDSYDNVDELRKDIMCYLKRKNRDELLDLELKLKVEIEEVNKSSISSSVIPIITFMLGVLVDTVLKEDRIALLIFIAGIILIAIIYSIYTSSVLKHYKYYIFYDEIIKRYKKENHIN